MNNSSISGRSSQANMDDEIATINEEINSYKQLLIAPNSSESLKIGLLQVIAARTEILKLVIMKAEKMAVPEVRAFTGTFDNCLKALILVAFICCYFL